jgi:hypothetical protein
MTAGVLFTENVVVDVHDDPITVHETQLPGS